MKKPSEEQTKIASEVALLKVRAMNAGLYRTARLIEIAVIEVGWELQGVPTPMEQLKRQENTLLL
jgi:hypothetical protein